MTLEWSDPPAPPPRQGRRGRQVAELKANPGQWALIEEYMTLEAAAALCGYFRREYGAEAQRHAKGVEWAVWARWPV